MIINLTTDPLSVWVVKQSSGNYLVKNGTTQDTVPIGTLFQNRALTRTIEHWAYHTVPLFLWCCSLELKSFIPCYLSSLIDFQITNQ